MTCHALLQRRINACMVGWVLSLTVVSREKDPLSSVLARNGSLAPPPISTVLLAEAGGSKLLAA